MRILLLGRGKTGSLVAEVACSRGHQVEVLASAQNPKGAALTKDRLQGIDVVIDFTTPHAVLDNISACLSAGTRIVVGTTGWYGELKPVRDQVEKSGATLLYASNFSLGVNLFFDIVRAGAAALRYGYSGQITETHHAQKKDKPSGTAVVLQRIVKEAAAAELHITSLREGEVVGTHSLTLDSPGDTIFLTHAAKSRRGFAEGAVRAAEWLKDKKGFFDFQEVWRQL